MCTSDFASSFGVGANTYGFTQPTPGVGANTYGFSTAPASSSIFTPGNASLALGAASGVAGLASSIAGTSNAITADNVQAEVAQTNALIAERASASAITTGQATVANTQQQGAQTIASQRVAEAANGVDVNTGSAANLQQSTDFVTTQNATTITANAARTAMGYNQQETNAANAYAADKMAAGNQSYASSAVTSLLGSATSVASNWYRQQRAGVN